SRANDVTSKRLGHRHDVIAPAVSKSLERRQEPNQQSISHGPNRHHRLGPEVTDLEHPWDALEELHGVPGEPIEELRRGRDEHVRPRQERRRAYAGNEKGQVAEAAPQEALVGGDVGTDPDDVDAVACLPLPQTIAIARIDDPAWVV